MTTQNSHRDFAEKSDTYGVRIFLLLLISLLVFDPGLEPLSDLSIEPIVKQEGIADTAFNM
jgi:hypothetical protein